MSDQPELLQLYRETILEHAVHPVGYQQDIDTTHRCELHNPLCGDHITLELSIENGLIKEASFDGESCAICTASASLLCKHLPQQQLDDLKDWSADLDKALNGEQETLYTAEFLQPLLGVKAYPGRIRCAWLPWEAALSAIKS